MASPRENLWLAARRIHGWSGTHGASRIMELQIGEFAKRLVGELAHGQRQLVEIGMVLVQRLGWCCSMNPPPA